MGSVPSIGSNLPSASAIGAVIVPVNLGHMKAATSSIPEANGPSRN
jgi:hypothetical protein